ncbi:sensor histidine kinase [Solicola gregarius]|uniref:histidine kinase n=1 Tax=Solicola gregarius TaxID=2908642 RepID=A0AA46YP01_9ACTN|nr:HAMP domain-containing sensor histidine kinase [Solicola gregarius]UYM07153.1 HAMP domain-containing histidine kinase [Solicola gregarius]
MGERDIGTRDAAPEQDHSEGFAPKSRLGLREQVSDRVTLAARITLLTTVAVGLTIAAVGVTIFLTVRTEVNHSLDTSLVKRAHAVAESSEASDQMRSGEVPAALAAADILIALVPADGGPIAMPGFGKYVGDPEVAVAQGINAESIRTVTIGDTPYRMVAVQSGRGTAVVLAQSMQSTARTLDRLEIALWVVGAAGVIVAGIAGWLVATNSLRPVRRLTLAAERVARTEQLTPIEVTGDDELARLTIAFNSMLTSLDASKQRQRQLVADAGHELRTPLTSLRTNIELLSQAEVKGGLAPRARGELMADVRAQIGELTTLVGDLVELARDTSPTRAPEATDLSEILMNCVQRVRLRAPGIEFNVDSEPWVVFGDGQLLERAITNLLDNAAKWSPPLGAVTVRLHDGVLTVADNGPGIHEEDLPHVFERFYRSREARMLPGSGLGLAIVAQAAGRHGGTVTARRAPSGGALMTLSIPGERPHPD